MEEISSDREKIQSTWQKIKNGTFHIFVDMLKGRTMNRLTTTAFLVIMFMQTYGVILMRSSYISWKDDIAADSIYDVLEIVRAVPAVKKLGSPSFFWFIYAFATAVIVITIAIFVYLIYCTIKQRPYASWPMSLLTMILSCFFWVLYNPVLETYVSSMQCATNGKLVVDSSIVCFSAIHISLMVISFIMLLCAVAIALLVSVLFQKTQPMSDDVLAHLESPLLVELAGYRTIIFVMCAFENDYFAIFLIKYLVMIAASILFIYQYIKFIPYFDSLISTLYGYLCFLEGWALIISLVTFIVDLSGHFVIFLVGVIPMYFVVENIRTRLIEIILLKPPEKTTSELEAILQSHAVYSLTTSKLTSDQEIRLTGLVNLHQKECANNKCPLYQAQELFDPCLNKFVEDGDVENLHKNQVFLKHFTKMYFETAISNFGNFAGIRIAYAFFLFHAFSNIHAALSELLHAKKCKPNIMQSFEIFKFEQMVEAHMLAESEKHKAVYYNLSRAIEFERVLKECLTLIWKTSDAQCSFWTHLQHPVMVDFNALDKDNESVYNFAKETDELWDKLCTINANYLPAITKYQQYLRKIRNNDQLANELDDRMKNYTIKKNLSTLAKNNDTLFDEKTAVLHVSGAKDAVGKVLKVNKGLQAVFGYSSNELLNNNINKIVPNLIGRRHNELMEHHFKTGRNRLFNKERNVFAIHKDGYCFSAKLLIKIMHKLEDGFIEYVGMIISTQDDYEYVLTDKFGAIDSISRTLAGKLGLNCKVIKSSGLNIQMIAPELICCYHEDGKKGGKGQKFKEAGGEEIVFIIPKGIKKVFEDQMKRTGKAKGEKIASESTNKLIKFNNIFNHRKSGKKGGEVTPQHLYQLEEYKNHLVKTKVKCEIQTLRFGLGRNEAQVHLRVLKVSGLRMRKDSVFNPVIDLSITGDKQIDSPGVEQKQVEEEKKGKGADNSGKITEEEKKPEMPQRRVDSDNPKIDPDPNDFEEENIVKMKVKEEKAELNLLETPREPLESSRKLLEGNASKTNRSTKPEPDSKGEAPAPAPESAGASGEDASGNVGKKEEVKGMRLLADHMINMLGTNTKADKVEGEETKNPGEGKEGLLRNVSMYPTLPEGAEPDVASPKKPKIIDIGEKGKIPSILAQYEESDREIALRKHFLLLQMKDKKAKEKEGVPGAPVEEHSDEKKQLLEQEEDLEEEAKEEALKEREEDDEGSMGSASTGATIRTYYSIRAAVDEKYVPSSIKNMNYMTIFMFVLLLALAITYYASEFSLYSSIQTNIKNIGFSEQRKNSLIDIQLRVKSLVLINMDNSEPYEENSVLDMTSLQKEALINQSQANLTTSALSLKQAQTELSLKTSNLDSGQISLINPSDVMLLYKQTTTDMPSFYLYTVWQAMLEVAVTALRVSNMSIGEINNNSPAVYLIEQNSLNSALLSLNLSTNELVNEIENSRSKNMTLFMIYLIVASAAAALSTIVLIPVINTAKKVKEKVLCLFFLLEDKEVKDYLKVSETFKKQNKPKNENEEQDYDDDNEDDPDNDPDGESKKEEGKEGKEDKKETKKEEKKVVRTTGVDRGEKKYKEIAIGFASLVIKLLIFVIIIEGYFVIVYFLSYIFLGQVSCLVTELKLLISRAPTHSFLLLIEKEVIMYNSTTTIEFVPASKFIIDYHSRMYGEEEQLLDRFANNKQYHTSTYNDLFKNIVFSNLCGAGLTTLSGSALDVSSCEAFNEGILKQGLYASVIKYWDYLRQLNTDFFNSKRGRTEIRQFMNEVRLQSAEKLQDLYFRSALNVLVKTLEKDIDNFFSVEFLKAQIIFICYFIYLIFVYVFVWRLFLNSITRELWKTKSILGIVKPERLMDVFEMRQFVLENSAAAFFSKR